MFLWRACWHIGVADSQALAQAGLLRFDQHSQQYVAEEYTTAVSTVRVNMCCIRLPLHPH